MKYFVAGGMYQKGDKKEFALVHPTSSDIPYVVPESHPHGWCDAMSFHTGTSHHSSLYKVSADCRRLELVHPGDARDKTDPKKVELNSTQQKNVMLGVEKAIKEMVDLGSKADEVKAE